MEGYANYVARTGYGLKKFIKPGFLDEFCEPYDEVEKDKINYDHLGAAINSMYEKYLKEKAKGKGCKRPLATKYIKGAAFYAACFESGARGSAIVNCKWKDIYKQQATSYWYLNYREQKIKSKRDKVKKCRLVDGWLTKKVLCEWKRHLFSGRITQNGEQVFRATPKQAREIMSYTDEEILKEHFGFDEDKIFMWEGR